jgi:hypothetical protein
MTINVKKHTPTFLFSALMFTCLGSNVVLAQVMPPVLTKRDFSVQIKDQPVALGDRWTPDSAGKIDVPWKATLSVRFLLTERTINSTSIKGLG